jgi:SAM-dependent methyltransferase
LPPPTTAFLPISQAAANYLRSTPLSHAVFRISELQYLARVELDRPFLDLGCGAGQFARMALEGTVDVGVDMSPRQVARARRTGRYGEVILADAADLPLADESVRTVLAVSSLEHMRRPERILCEVQRVLKPGGVFAATVVLPEFRSHLFYSGLARKIGLGLLARLYVGMHDRVFAHRTLLPQERWEQLTENAGLQVIESKRFFSAAITRSYDFWLPPAIPYRLLAALGMPWVLPLPWRRKIAERILAKEWRAGGVSGRAGGVSLLSGGSGTPNADGSLLFLLARKPEEP